MDVAHQKEDVFNHIKRKLIMAKTNQPRGKLVRKFGKIFLVIPNLINFLIASLMALANMLKREEEKYPIMVFSFKKSKKLNLCMVF